MTSTENTNDQAEYQVSVQMLPYIPQELQDMIMEQFLPDPRVLQIRKSWFQYGEYKHTSDDEPLPEYLLNRIITMRDDLEIITRPHLGLDMTMNKIGHGARQIFKKAYQPLLKPHRNEKFNLLAKKILVDQERDTVLISTHLLSSLKLNRDFHRPDLLQFDKFKRLALSINTSIWQVRDLDESALDDTLHLALTMVHEMFPNLDELIITTSAPQRDIYDSEPHVQQGSETRLVQGKLEFEDLDKCNDPAIYSYKWVVPGSQYTNRDQKHQEELENLDRRSKTHSYMERALAGVMKAYENEGNHTWENKKIRLCDVTLNMGTWKWFYEYDLAIELRPDGNFAKHERYEDSLARYVDSSEDVNVAESYFFSRSLSIYPSIAPIRDYISEVVTAFINLQLPEHFQNLWEECQIIVSGYLPHEEVWGRNFAHARDVVE